MPLPKRQPNYFQPQAKAYQPTMRDNAAGLLQNLFGDSYAVNKFSRGLLGSSGLGGGAGPIAGMGLLDMTPLGAAFALEEAGRKIGRGDRVGGVADAALAVVPIPAAARVAKGGAKALQDVRIARARQPDGGLNMAWLTRDVVPGGGAGGSSAERRAANYLSDNKLFTTEELPISGLVATQNSVNPDFMKSKASKDAPAVFKIGGAYYLRDGHHRVAAQAASGNQTAKVRLFDVDAWIEDGRVGADPFDPQAQLFPPRRK
jgi:hypothetical protein